MWDRKILIKAGWEIREQQPIDYFCDSTIQKFSMKHNIPIERLIQFRLEDGKMWVAIRGYVTGISGDVDTIPMDERTKEDFELED